MLPLRHAATYVAIAVLQAMAENVSL